ncbi:enoyl-CoA hydratase/isomerase family protein [Desulfosarcina ovata]|uniref:Short-chain-enoyl-CoA hydratase n=2 Tax=Desulfosarcina ovata TaxID=83564 RepID=A0A5K8AJR7_9BACT|nr:enoyl-CoA hydratase-related protein [Desulfosarcina ovata]BBO85987.1 short-chain-enoyl-CoA hydratase [Desulfosarcina ovata subsp. sediminis]BBO92945.1 short-chain-enoyl-CoA hydratase [Desulfosarcina ovata subsp. ovata]
MDAVLNKKGPIATITINREASYNALNQHVLGQLKAVFKELESDSDVMCAIITGAGQKAFVAGADIHEIKNAGPGRVAVIREGLNVFSKISHSSKVIIAAVNGYALGGGCELAMACDIRLASEKAKFALPEASLGLMPGYGGTQRLPRLVGVGKAKYMMFSGQMIDAAQALAFGLVEKVCKAETLMQEAEALARSLSKKGPLALKAIKQAINSGMDMPLAAAIEYEFEQYGKIAVSQDAEEGMNAFIEKREPVFKGA